MIGDCLVFRIIEKDNSAQGEDTDIYILYDVVNEVFLLRGKRSDVPNYASRPYSFEAYDVKDVIQFLSVIISNSCIFELYSYPNLPRTKDEITFDLLRYTRSPANEVVAYISQRIRSKNTRQILASLANIANDYEEELDEESSV